MVSSPKPCVKLTPVPRRSKPLDTTVQTPFLSDDPGSTRERLTIVRVTFSIAAVALMNQGR